MAFVRRKKKGNTFFYELVENTWEKGKTKQKVVQYFPTLEAANLYCEQRGIHKLETKLLISPHLEKQLNENLDILNKARPLPESTLKNLKDIFEIEITYNSNAIEGNRLTLRETWLVIRKGMTIGGKTVEEHLEAKNHAEALEFLYELVDKGREIKENDVLQLHKLVLDKISSEYAGKYRDRQVFISGATHIPPAASEVPKLMKQVIIELNNRDKKTKAVISASKVHYLTTKIHPFIDGNGRVARLLLNLRLMRAGFPPVVLHKTERRSYYSALEKADDGDLYPITTLIAKNIEKSLETYLSALEKK
ncbi:MAG: Fic family protein [Candidatus Micrarchaeota archaeon]